MARSHLEKQDGVLRLLSEVTLFQAVPYGLTGGQIAERMEINQRTAQRDIAALESELRVPFIKDGTRWQVVPEYWLPPLNLNVQEMVSLLLAARLMLRFSDRATRSPSLRSRSSLLLCLRPCDLKRRYGASRRTSRGRTSDPADDVK